MRGMDMKPTDEELEAMAVRLEDGRVCSPAQNSCRNGYWMLGAAAMLRACKGRVRVKPLVWHRADLSAWGEYANAGLLRYRMTWTYRDDPEVWFTMKCEHDGKVLYQGGSEEAAIAAANADCSARILAALEPTPDHAEWNAAIEAAANSVKDHSDSARKSLSGCYHEGQPEDAAVWSAIISHLDIARDKIASLKKGQTND